jgi:hypothetical protein
MAKPPLDRQIQPARHPDYRRLSTRVDRHEHRLEDTISHFHKVINEMAAAASIQPMATRIMIKMPSIIGDADDPASANL